MRNRGLASQETPQEHMIIVRQKISFQHQAPIRKTNVFSTCFYTSFLSHDFPFCIDSLHTCSYSHLDFHTRHLFTEIAYQVTQVPREFDTQFLLFYTTCVIRCTCRKRTHTQPNHKNSKPVRELSLAQQGALSSTSLIHNNGLAQQLRLALFKGLTNRSILALSLTGQAQR